MVIERPPSAVWPAIVTPQLFVRWNEKIRSIEARDRFVPNQPFATHYLWRDRQLQCLSIVTKLVEPELLELHHRQCVGPSTRTDLDIIERIELDGSGSRTVVTKTVIVSNHGIPWFLLPLIWLVGRFGTPADTGKPDPLKKLCENGPELSVQ